MNGCPSRDQLERFLGEALSSAELILFGDHIQGCDRCQQTLDALMRDSFPATEVLSQIRSNPPPFPRPTYLSPRPIVFPLPPNERAPLGRLNTYLVSEKLGEGSYGVVFRAYDEKLARWVALKVLRPELAAQEKVRQRFLHEARAAAAVKDPNVVVVHTVAEATPDFPQPYLVMEFVEGESLRVRLNRQRPSQKEAVRLVQQAARGLGAAHRRGVIHRDVKPDNILLETDGNEVRAKIADFGIAQAVEEVRGKQLLGSIVGTLPYMSPEAFQPGDTVDARSDLFSLGVTLYELLTGRFPFPDRKPIAEGTLRVDLPSEIPPDLGAIIRKCLTADAEARYETANDLAHHLNLWLGHEPVPLRRHGLLERFGLWYRRRPDAAWLAIGLCVTVAAGLVSLILWQLAERDTAHRLQRDREHVAVDLRDARRDRDQGNYQSAATILARALWTHKDVPGLSEERDRLQNEWKTLRDLSSRFHGFHNSANEAWSAAGEERGVNECVDSCERALGNFGADDASTAWWQREPATLLTATHRRDVEAEAHRLLLLLAAMRVQQGLLGYETRALNNTDLGPASGQALEALRAARALEEAGRVPRSRTASLLEKGAQKLKDLPANKLVFKTRIEFNFARVGDYRALSDLESETDLFFNGVVHVFLAKHRNDNVAKALKLLGPDDFDFTTPAESAERLLRRAAQRGGGHFWNHFMLGRILLSNKDYRGAELAFNSCVQVAPAYSRGFEQRGLALAHQAATAPADWLRQGILGRMDADLQRAIELSPQDPSTYWVRGHALRLFASRRDQALSAYAKALELEDNLAERVSRRNQLNEIQAFCTVVLKSEPGNSQALALRDLANRVLKRLEGTPPGRKTAP
jgi:tRNA A-37 threonylcarbamoyl transferase component Bud32/tetratricopeptide (TPR) repeat protein